MHDETNKGLTVTKGRSWRNVIRSNTQGAQLILTAKGQETRFKVSITPRPQTVYMNTEYDARLMCTVSTILATFYAEMRNSAVKRSDTYHKRDTWERTTEKARAL